MSDSFHTSLKTARFLIRNRKVSERSKRHLTLELGVSKPKASQRRALRALHKARLRAYQWLFYVKSRASRIGVSTSRAGATCCPPDCHGDCSMCANM